MNYLLCAKNKKTGVIIARHCSGKSLDAAKNDYIRIIKEVVGLNIVGGFKENFKLISKQVILD